MIATLPTRHYLHGVRGDDCRPVSSTPACTAHEGQRAAICLTGSPRTFTRPHVVRSIASHLVGGLKAAADVFAVLRPRDAAGKDGWAAQPRLSVNDGELASALAVLSPRMVWLDTHDEAQAYGLRLNENCSTNGFMTSRQNLMRSVAQPAAWQRCMHMVRRAERNDSARYSHVIRTRPDLYWFWPHPPLCTLRADYIYVHRWLDWHFVLPRPIASRVLSMVDEYKTCQGDFRHRSLESWLRTRLESVAAKAGATKLAKAALGGSCWQLSSPTGSTSTQMEALSWREKQKKLVLGLDNDQVLRGSNASVHTAANLVATGIDILMFPATLVRNASTSGDASWLVREFCVPYVLLGAVAADDSGHSASASRVSCDVRGHLERQLRLADTQCMRRVYPTEVAVHHGATHISTRALAEWWSKTAESSLCTTSG